VSKELHGLAERLRKARTDDDYVETDLRAWTTMLEKLKRDVTTVSPSVAICQDPEETLVTKIYVSTTKQHIEQGERFGESFGNILICDSGRAARHTGPQKNYAFVRGTGEYSSGRHKIRFQVNKKNAVYLIFFGIISKLTLIPQNQNVMETTACGWYSSDGIVPSDGGLPVSKDFRDMKGQLKLDIELVLDCDNQMISYFNQQTKNTREMNVDTKKFPLPWQILFYLYDIEDSVRLLSSTQIL
jgi:hypothetical protein